MNRLPPDSYDAAAAEADLPPLVKGYLRLGGFVGDGAVIDHQFNTTDVSDRREMRRGVGEILSQLCAPRAKAPASPGTRSTRGNERLRCFG